MDRVVSLHGGLPNVSAVYDDDYGTAVAAADMWVDSPAGVPVDTWRETNEFLQSYSDVAVAAANVLHHGSPWGALQESVSGTPIARSLLFTLAHDEEEAAPWAELLFKGAFSQETLARIPTSWMVDRQWTRLIEQSAAKDGATWLHHLYLATAAAEEGDFARAELLFNNSLAASPNSAGTPHALRGLASLANDRRAKTAYYARAWDAVHTLVDRGVPRARDLQRHLAAETAHVLVVYTSAPGGAVALTRFMASVNYRLTPSERAHDAIVQAWATDLLARGDNDLAIAVLRRHFFVASGCPGGGRTSSLIEPLWDRAHSQAAEHRLGRPLTPLERKKLLLANPPPPNIGARCRLPAGSGKSMAQPEPVLV